MYVKTLNADQAVSAYRSMLASKEAQAMAGVLGMPGYVGPNTDWDAAAEALEAIAKGLRAMADEQRVRAVGF